MVIGIVREKLLNRLACHAKKIDTKLFGNVNFPNIVGKKHASIYLKGGNKQQRYWENCCRGDINGKSAATLPEVTANDA